jgi:predicted nucleic acid-binding protein
MPHIRTMAFDDSIYPTFEEIVGRGNVTRVVNDLMASVVKSNGGSSELDAKLRKKKIEQLQSKQAKIQAELQLEIMQEKKLEEQARKREIEELEIKINSKCKICGIVSQEKMHDFPIGKVCNNCYQNKRDSHLWFKKEAQIQ